MAAPNWTRRLLREAFSQLSGVSRRPGWVKQCRNVFTNQELFSGRCSKGGYCQCTDATGSKTAAFTSKTGIFDSFDSSAFPLKNVNFAPNQPTQCIGKLLEETAHLLQDAEEVQGTVYFEKDMVEAERHLKQILQDYNNLMMNLDQEEKREVRLDIGCKINDLMAFKDFLTKESLKNRF